MFCTNCGAQLKDDARFCVNCGQPVKARPQSAQPAASEAAPAAAAAVAAAQIPQPAPAPQPEFQAAPEPQPAPQPYQWAPQEAAAPEPQPAPQPGFQGAAYPHDLPPAGQGFVPAKNEPEKKEEKKKGGWLKWLLIGGGAALLVAAAVLLIIFVFGKKYPINMNDYLKVKFDGYSTVGEATVKFDEKAFREEFGEKLKWKKKDYQSYGEPVDFLLSVYTGKLDKAEKLKNGDTVTYQWKLKEEFPEGIMNAEIKAEDVSFKVEGLKEAKIFDPFDQIKIEVDGYDGYGRITAVDGIDAYADYVCYASVVNEDILTSNHLKNGDEVVLAINHDDDSIEFYAKNFGVIPSETTKTFKVEGLKEVGSFDPFEKLKVEFKGFNGSGYATITNESDLDAAKSLYFNIDPSGSLKNGDEVRIYLDLTDSELERMAGNYGMLPGETEKTYTVANLEHYAESYEELGETAEEMVKFMIDKLKEEYKTREQYGFYLDDIGYVGYYFMKDDPSDDSDNGNQYYVLIRLQIRSDSGAELICFAPCQFAKVKIDTKGKVEFDPATYSKKYVQEPTLQIKSKQYTMTVYAYDTLEAAEEGLTDPESKRNTGLVLESTDFGGES